MQSHDDDIGIFAGDGLGDLFAAHARLFAILIERFGGIAAILGIVEKRTLIRLVVEKYSDNSLLLQHPREQAEVFDGDRPVAEKVRGPIHVYDGKVMPHPGEDEAIERRKIAGHLRIAASGAVHDGGTGRGGNRQAIERERFDVGEVVAQVFRAGAVIALLRIDKQGCGGA